MRARALRFLLAAWLMSMPWLLPVNASAGQLYAETQTEVQAQSGQFVAVVRQVVEWQEEDWSAWLITEGRQSLSLPDRPRFGFDLAYMRPVGQGDVTLGFRRPPIGQDLVYLQYARPW